MTIADLLADAARVILIGPARDHQSALQPGTAVAVLLARVTWRAAGLPTSLWPG